jgi:Tol biopolymer transport system component
MTGNFHFTPDGKALAFVVQEKGVDNVWVEPLDGTTAHPITNFASEEILDFRWPPDGKSLAVLRFNSSSDVVLMRDGNASAQ